MRLRFLLHVSILVATLAGAACARVPVSAADGSSVSLNGHRFSVEVARNPAAREHGLMDRASMPADHGMLFVFSHAQRLTFWMKNTLIPLDILFFNSAHRLVTIQANAQPCKASRCRLYPSSVPARYVLELNAGTSARIGARKGDILRFVNVPPSASR